jgi:hypothetical protein
MTMLFTIPKLSQTMETTTYFQLFLNTEYSTYYTLFKGRIILKKCISKVKVKKGKFVPVLN